MPYIFLDESGQFTKNKNGYYFVVGSFTVGNPRRTEKQFRSWHKTKFPKKLRYQSEIKFSEIKIDDALRLKTLKFIANLDVRIHYTFLLKQNIPDEYFKKDKLKSGHLYAEIIAETLDMYLPVADKEFRVFCDQRHLKGIKRSEFKSSLRTHILPKLSQGSVVQIEMIDSVTNANIQIADWISGTLAWFLEKKKLGEEGFQILKNNILGGGKELFKNHWDNKHINKKSQFDN